MFHTQDGRPELLRFKFYSENETKALSVCRITNELAFDKYTGRGVDEGLHDISLGLYSEKELCGHCNLDFFSCPGHFGHINLAKPVFNPMFFDLLFKLIKSFCFCCFRLYSVDYLAAVFHHLGAPAHSLPGRPKQADLYELMGLASNDLRKIALKSLCSRPRIPCKLCCSRSWIIRHVNKQQLLMHPVLMNSRARASKSELNSQPEDGEGIDDMLELSNMQDPRLASHTAEHDIFINPDDGLVKASADEEKAKSALFESTRDELMEISKSCVNSKDVCVLPEFIQKLLRCLWLNDGGLLCLLVPMLNSAKSRHQFATDVFFMENILLSPSLCRLPRYVAGLAFEHPETAVYSRVVQRAQCLSHIVEFMKQKQQEGGGQCSSSQFEQSVGALSNDPESTNVQIQDSMRTVGALKLACVLLQASVNGLYDSYSAIIPSGLDSKVGGSGSSVASVIRLPGLRQRLEKKEGLFRMHMMGKRVNYACRSVISPDPNLDVTEVGIPLFFATRLTFPAHVNVSNLSQLRQLIINGPDKYPGARSFRTPEGQLIHLPKGNSVQIKRKREIFAQRITSVVSDSHGAPYVVHRHLLNGDMLVMNRQPSLHKPSMQAHRVRIIHSREAKTLRMHYSNCRAYNADFDGDEMNGHLVQTYDARAELEHLAAVPYQYLGPKDGTPLAGLIQDHVIAAVQLTTKNRFFNHMDYMDLVYHSLRSVFALAGHSTQGPPNLITLRPAIMWPKRLWTGKQIISTLLMNLTPPEMPHLNCFIRGKRTKAELWSGVAPGGSTPLSDADLIVCDGYLASGILDKAHIGSSSGGLVHCMYEIYGPKAAAHLLNGINLLSNRLLKFTAFTMGIKDMLLSTSADKDRARRFAKLQDLGLCAFADAFELKPDALSEANVRRLYRHAHFAPATDQVLKKRLAQLDNSMKDRLKRAQDAVCDAAIPSGLYVGFPENNLQLMVHVGAKGGMVNAQQMSVALGQIELEGRRVPLMLSGRSLPSFPPYDVRPRAGGMCTHRFLTSLPPQELFFHSMAGRDGLIDTAIKTSRSGYLQRSAIKHLEDLSIQYDGTVRDSGNSVIQFRYGEDGVDVCQASFLNQSSGLHLFADNAQLLTSRWRVDAIHPRVLERTPLSTSLQQIADKVGIERQMMLMHSIPDPKISKLFRKQRKTEAKLEQIIRSQDKLTRVELLNSDSPEAPCDLSAALRELCVAKLTTAQAPPGEPVGLLAAQSVGEPSTQMTLNTFHFAGRGEMNVTLGIPRLREILMSGASQLSTPCMEVPVRPTYEARKYCNRIAKRFYKLKLVEAIRLPIHETVDYASDSCTLEFEFEPASSYAERSNVKPSRVLRFFERVLFPDLAKRLDRELRDHGKATLIRSFALSALARQQNKTSTVGDGDDNDAMQDEDGSGGGNLSKFGHRTRDEWNDDDGHEAIRRRRMEAECEQPPTGVTEVDVGGDVDDDDDDDEAAELRELGVDPEKAELDEDLGTDKEDLVDDTFASSKLKSVVDECAGRKSDDQACKNANEYVEADSDADDMDTTLIGELDKKNEMDEEEFELESRRTFVTRLHARFSNYDFDRSKTPTWARLTICMFDPKEGRISIDLKTLVMRIVNKGVVSSVPGIEKAIVDRTNQSEWMFRVEGINMVEIMRYPSVFDLTRLYTNSISIMYQTYGIEAARATIQKEVSGVFGHYGIYVNPRHLSLITDYMTKQGIYRAFNRANFVGHPSPLQQMSFETVINALKETIQEDRVDTLLSPSASIITGRIVHNAGTNCFDLCQKLAY